MHFPFAKGGMVPFRHAQAFFLLPCFPLLTKHEKMRYLFLHEFGNLKDFKIAQFQEITMVEFDKKVEQLIKQTEKNNNWRQRECINLIPSESTPS